jgi:retron-type reverse transcriptase
MNERNGLLHFLWQLKYKQQTILWVYVNDNISSFQNVNFDWKLDTIINV